MNMRLFTVLSAVSVLALAACTTTTGDGSGGAGGGSGGGTSGNTTTGDTTTANGTGGTGGGGDCIFCGDALTDADTPLCDADAEAKYDALAACTCDAGGNCADECGDNVCMGMDPDAACAACIPDTNVNGGCGTEYTDCVNDN